ncbi:MAG: DPP IV N-terminal domain-containing protein [Paludibacter sp.]|jgi:dipeptidyl-peptidase-4|nr:DPP IV N-terminal domain-containing protein [Paludibacter sp.]
MKKIIFTSIAVLFIVFGNANLLYDITDGKFRPKMIAIPRSMNDGEFYSSAIDNQAIIKCEYRSGNVVDTLFSISKAKKCPFKDFAGYEFSPDEKKILLYRNVHYRYRRSFTADYYIYDIKRREITPLSEYGSQEVPLFSPDSRYVAFARENNLYIRKLDFGTEIAVTNDGIAGKIINGIPDWVYEEEFVTTRHFGWSSDSKLLAYTKFNETEVPEFALQKFTAPAADKVNTLLYPQLLKFKYPKAGENNSKVSVHVYDDFNKTTRTMQLPATDQDFYIPKIQWTAAPDQLAILKLNRTQNRYDFIIANAKSTISKSVFSETDSRYVDYSNDDNLYFTADNQSFFHISEHNGYRHIYQYNINGSLMRQITSGNWDVTEFYGYDEAKKTLYYQSAETSPLQRNIFSIDNKGKKTKLTNSKGIHSATFNNSFSYFVDNYSSLSEPNAVNLCNAAGKIVRPLIENNELKSQFISLQLPEKQFISIPTSDGTELNAWILKPANFDETKKYPLLLVQYSGPNSQEVLDRWNIGWEYYLASKGIVVACADGRGTGARGAEFRKCTYGQLGILETRDQIETAKYFGNQPFIDETRIGIWGWSFGGSMTVWALSASESVFKIGIAVAPVTDWRLYDSAYTERFMGLPQSNFKAYEQTSALPAAQNLNGKLLIIHGTADDNVHYQNTLLYIKNLIDADKQFEVQIYPDSNHSILGQQTRRHLYTRMSEFVIANL